MQTIIYSTAIVAILGILIGLFLCISSEIFKVEVDENIIKIRNCLPGNNCGGCGYPGCDNLAEAIAKGEAETNSCTVGGESVATEISKILGVKNKAATKMVAHVHCNGDCDSANRSYDYVGIKDCRVASNLPIGGEKACEFACLGYGNCVAACKFGAINVVKGVAKVDKEKCVGCSACIKACPMKIIDLVPYDKKHIVNCSNKRKGKSVMDDCKVSCIACGLCEKNCKVEAIKVENNLATMNYDKCNDCGDCHKKCPRKCIS